MGTNKYYEGVKWQWIFLITLAKTRPSEGMTVGNPTVDRTFVGAGELFASRVDAAWAVISYLVTHVADNAVVGAKPNSSRHTWQAKIPSSGEFYEPTCFVVANLR